MEIIIYDIAQSGVIQQEILKGYFSNYIMNPHTADTFCWRQSMYCHTASVVKATCSRTAASTLSLCLNRMRSGTVLSAGHPCFGSAHSTTHNHSFSTCKMVGNATENRFHL